MDSNEQWGPTSASRAGRAAHTKLSPRMTLIAALLSATITFSLTTAATAGAATPPTGYTLGGVTACTTFSQNTTQATDPNIPSLLVGLTAGTPTVTSGLITVHRPTYVANYTGTRSLYWDAAVYVLNSARQWQSIGTVGGVYAGIFLHYGTQLTSIYWNQELPGAGMQITITNPAGHRYLVVGETYWWNGSSWFTSTRNSIGECQF
ncbi:MAG: hypothetical protein ACYDHN_15245 [Solirubrobacteraceae bacterium]